MSYQRYKSLDKNLIFAEYMNSEQETRRNGGVPTDVIFDKGVATFNGSSSDIDIDKCTACSDCQKVCPIETPDLFDQ